jgi:hypothetical protein
MLEANYTLLLVSAMAFFNTRMSMKSVFHDAGTILHELDHL